MFYNYISHLPLHKLTSRSHFACMCVSGDITEDVELIEGLEETKRIATDIGQRSALARETQVGR